MLATFLCSRGSRLTLALLVCAAEASAQEPSAPPGAAPAPFAEYKGLPVLSAICSNRGLQDLDEYMKAQGFREKFAWTPNIRKVPGIERREHYLAKVYDYPERIRDKPVPEKEDLLMNAWLGLRRLGESDRSIFAFSFYPDVLTLKEVGDPLAVGEFFGLDTSDITAKIILAQGRQNTNYGIYLYA